MILNPDFKQIGIFFLIGNNDFIVTKSWIHIGMLGLPRLFKRRTAQNHNHENNVFSLLTAIFIICPNSELL